VRLKSLALLAMLLPAARVPGCAFGDAPVAAPVEPPRVRGRWLMGAPCEVRAFGAPVEVDAAVEQALDRIAALEQVMTTWRADGELALLNRRCAEPGAAGLPLPVSPELARILALARTHAAATGGAFDPSVGALVAAWGLMTGGREPSAGELEGALWRTGFQRFSVSLDPPTVTCARPGVAFDLGAIGKGIALDEAAGVLRAAGVTRALLNFGGQVLALDPPPGATGWIVDLADPADRVRPVKTVTLSNASVAITGNSERAVDVGGRTRGHVIDPRSGQPIERAGSAVVTAPTAAEADALSTALFVVGPTEAASLLAAGTRPATRFEFLPPGGTPGEEEDGP